MTTSTTPPPTPTPHDEVDALLANGRLGGPTRERILGRVLDAVEPPRVRVRGIARRLLLALVPLAAAVAVFVFAVVRPANGPAPRRSGGELRAKGPGVPAPPAVDVLCEDGVGTCRAGQRLYFRVDASPEPRWLAAYAEPADGPSGSGRIWMLPENDQVAPEVPAAGVTSILRRAVELGSAISPGRYRVTLLVFDHPAGRAEASDPRAQARRIVRSLEVR